MPGIDILLGKKVSDNTCNMQFSVILLQDNEVLLTLFPYKQYYMTLHYFFPIENACQVSTEGSYRVL